MQLHSNSNNPVIFFKFRKQISYFAYLKPLEYRSIQIELKGEAVELYTRQWI